MTARPLRRGSWSVQELERLRHLVPRRGVDDAALLLRRSPDSVRRKAAELFAGPLRRASWTADDDLALCRSWGAVEPHLLTVLLRRPFAEVQRRAAVLRAAPRSGPWTRHEEQLLKELFGTRADEDLEVCLQRRRADILQAAERLCLQKDKRFTKTRSGAARPARRMPRWAAADVDRLREVYPDRDNLEVARLLGRSVASVANKANQLGLHKSSDLLAHIGRTNVRLRYEDG